MAPGRAPPVADYYRKDGYEVEHCGTGSRSARFDGGVDLRLVGGAETIVVQCRHWNAYKMPHNEVHQLLLGIMVNEQATSAILVTSGKSPRQPSKQRAATGTSSW